MMCNNEAHNNELLLHRTNGRVFCNRLGLVDDFGSHKYIQFNRSTWFTNDLIPVIEM